jgi:hypothetical protein
MWAALTLLLLFSVADVAAAVALKYCLDSAAAARTVDPADA